MNLVSKLGKTCCFILFAIRFFLLSCDAQALEDSSKPSTAKVLGNIIALPGSLDEISVFNSNNPEIVKTEGILLSTFPKTDSLHPEAHLDYPFSGRFDVFFHHINDCREVKTTRTLYLALIVKDASESDKVKLKIISAASYLSRPDSPFISLPDMSDNETGKIYAGPGDRVMLDSLKCRKQLHCHHSMKLKPAQSKIFYVFPIPVDNMDHPLNGRSALLKFSSNGPVYAALVARFLDDKEVKYKHASKMWLEQLATAPLAGERNFTPSKPGEQGPYKYGRVAGVSKGSTWLGEIALSVEKPQTNFYPLSTVAKATFGTGQVQSAPIIVRYPDTAYEAHSNYGVHYVLDVNLTNDGNERRKVNMAIETPLKSDSKEDGMSFYTKTSNKVMYRGSIQMSFPNGQHKSKSEIEHLVQHYGQRMPELLTFEMEPYTKQSVRIEFFYPPDSTPPQVLTITSAQPGD